MPSCYVDVVAFEEWSVIVGKDRRRQAPKDPGTSTLYTYDSETPKFDQLFLFHSYITVLFLFWLRGCSRLLFWFLRWFTRAGFMGDPLSECRVLIMLASGYIYIYTCIYIYIYESHECPKSRSPNSEL